MEFKDFFDVRKNACDSDDFTIIEDCADTEGALSGYFIICYDRNIDGLIKWVEDNCKDITDYVADNIRNGNMPFAIDLVKPTIGIDSITDEFIADCGSVQDFLDRYGNEGSEISFSSVTDAKKEDGIDASSLEEPEREEEVPIGVPSCLSGIQDDSLDLAGFGDEPSDSAIEEEDETSSPEEPAFKDDTTTDESDSEEVDEEPEAAETGEEPESAETGEEPESTCFNSDGTLGAPEIECDGIAVPFMNVNNGKISIKFSDLANLVNFVTEASAQLEEEDAKDTRILTESEKHEAAKVLDHYSPAVVKEFMLRYVLEAESSADYIRITSVLNSFCAYIEENKIDSFE